MAIIGIFVINRAGGLVFNQEHGSGFKCAGNDYLILASMFQSIHAISAQISPIPHSSGIRSMETESFRLTCHQTPTGMKFVAVTDFAQSNIDSVLNKVYELYSDHVLKNPFCVPDMPIRCPNFANLVGRLIHPYSA